MYFGTAVMLVVNPVNTDLAIGTVFTMIAYSALAFFTIWHMKLNLPVGKPE